MTYRVIIIEDDPMVAAINRQYTEVTPSFRVEKLFKSGKEALEYLKMQTADLMILDYYTPLMNGAEFIDALHRMGKTPSIIMVTSANDTDIIRSLIGRGVIDYLVKPFEYCRFKAALDRFLEARAALSNMKGSLDQHSIDRLLPYQRQPSETSSQLAKGLSETTLKLIQDFLRDRQDNLFTSEQIAEQLHLSRITIRRYMNYLLETGEIISTIDYKTGGRPSIKYGLTGEK